MEKFIEIKKNRLTFDLYGIVSVLISILNRDDERKPLHYIYADSEDGETKLVATDGKRLGIVYFKEIPIPLAKLETGFYSFIKNKKKIILYKVERKLTFPNYENAFPKEDNEAVFSCFLLDPINLFVEIFEKYYKRNTKPLLINPDYLSAIEKYIPKELDVVIWEQKKHPSPIVDIRQSRYFRYITMPIKITED